MSGPKPAPKRKGRPQTVSGEQIAAAIVQFNGNLKAVARALGVVRSSVQERVAKSETLARILHDVREGELDDAESALYRAILNGAPWAVCFKLKCQGKARGYIEKPEEGKGDATSTQAATDQQVASALAGALRRVGGGGGPALAGGTATA